ncbi:hypothetical protein [Nitrobacter sp. JJSN]|jgi:hypothetical protein|uniref:hypothetical protein n=1 Tax=Nitrobacter sp. JJSN TaxID=3453033 RepID=UPI003F75E4C3
MNKLVERRAARAGIGAAVARVAVGTIPDFQRKEGPADKVQSLKAGAENAIEQARSFPRRRTFAGSHQAPSYS